MPLEEIPSDVLVEVFSLCSSVEVLAVSATCRLLHRLATGDHVWRPRLSREDKEGFVSSLSPSLSLSSPSSSSWYDAFRAYRNTDVDALMWTVSVASKKISMRLFVEHVMTDEIAGNPRAQLHLAKFFQVLLRVSQDSGDHVDSRELDQIFNNYIGYDLRKALTKDVIEGGFSEASSHIMFLLRTSLHHEWWKSYFVRVQMGKSQSSCSDLLSGLIALSCSDNSTHCRPECILQNIQDIVERCWKRLGATPPSTCEAIPLFECWDNKDAMVIYDQLPVLQNHIPTLRQNLDSNIMSRQAYIGSLNQLEVLRVVLDVILIEGGFSGEQCHYYSKRNSNIHEVFETKKGIPLSLCCIVYICAECVGLQGLEIAELPGHVMLRIDAKNIVGSSSSASDTEHTTSPDEDTAIYVDAYSGVDFLTATEAKHRLAIGETFLGELAVMRMEPVGVFLRTCNNLLRACRHRNIQDIDLLKYILLVTSQAMTIASESEEVELWEAYDMSFMQLCVGVGAVSLFKEFEKELRSIAPDSPAVQQALIVEGSCILKRNLWRK